MSTLELTIKYKPEGARESDPHVCEYVVKKHDDVFVDNIGICKIYDIKFVDGKMPVVPEPGGQGLPMAIEYVSPNLVRPASAFSEADLRRQLRMLDNAREIERLGLGAQSTPTKKQRVRAPRETPPVVERSRRHATAASMVPQILPG